MLFVLLLVFLLWYKMCVFNQFTWLKPKQNTELTKHSHLSELRNGYKKQGLRRFVNA